MTVIALLRGINVGGHNRLPMADLRTIAANCGYADARTYLQSGNLVLTAGATGPAEVETTLTAAIADQAGLTVPVIARTSAAIGRVVATSPYATEAEADPTRVLVTFLPSAATADLRAFDSTPFAPDDASVAETEVYLSVPNGMARSKLTAKLSRLDNAADGTTRNWRTVLALADMANR